MSKNSIGIEELERNVSRQRVWLNNDNKILQNHTTILKNLAKYLCVFITEKGQVVSKKSKFNVDSEA